MNTIASLSAKERSLLFAEAASIRKLPAYIIEKDFWVSWVLEKIFTESGLTESLCFKGGTSLSKGFGLIDRFSEDIDLILAQSLVLYPGEEINKASKTQQQKFNTELNRRACEYITKTLNGAIQKAISPICTVEANPLDGHVLWIKFPGQLKYTYIKPNIKLEIGPLALWTPNEQSKLSSYLAQALPELKLKDAIVPTIKPERTFWEKITILHMEHHRPQDKMPPERYSRHYYDVHKLSKSFVKEIALTNKALLTEVSDFKDRFYSCGWARYDTARIGTIRLLPAPHSQPPLANDYKKMKNMIFGEYPSWEEICRCLVELEAEMNSQ